MIAILMIPGKLATSSLLKITVFFHDFTNQIYSHATKSVTKSSVSMIEVIRTSFKIRFFLGGGRGWVFFAEVQ